MYADKPIAWLISNLRTNEFAELFNTELASTRMRAGVCISGCEKEGFTVLPPNYRDPSHDPDVVFMAKFVPDSNTGQYLDDSGVRRGLWLRKIDVNQALNHRQVNRPWGVFDSIEKGERFQVKKITVKCGGRLSLQNSQNSSTYLVS